MSHLIDSYIARAHDFDPEYAFAYNIPEANSTTGALDTFLIVTALLDEEIGVTSDIICLKQGSVISGNKFDIIFSVKNWVAAKKEIEQLAMSEFEQRKLVQQFQNN